MTTDATESKLCREALVKHKRKLPEKVFNFFSNKSVKRINLPSILYTTQLVSLSKDLPCNFVTTAIVYKLQQPIICSIFNFKKFLPNTNVDPFLTDTCGITYVCENSALKNSYDAHIVTSGPRVIKHNEIRKFFTKGLNYRELRKINNDQARKNIINDAEVCVSA